MDDRAAERQESRRIRVKLWSVATIVVVAFVLRLAAGMHQPLEADEATAGIQAARMLQGHFALMEADARYLGNLLTYLLVPFIAVMGSTQLAVRVGTAAVGAAYVAVTYELGKNALGGHWPGVAMAAIAAALPATLLTFGVHARDSYPDGLVCEALLFLLVARIAWRGDHRAWRPWAWLGLVVGVGLWSAPLFLLPTAVAAAGLMLRRRAMGTANLMRGFGIALVPALVGLSPRVVDGVMTSFTAYGLIPINHVGTRNSVYSLASLGVPYFLGTEWFLNWHVTDALVLLLVVGALGLRLQRFRSSSTAHADGLLPIDLFLGLGALCLVAVTVGGFNALNSFPDQRYLMPAALPLAGTIAFVLVSLGRRWRVPFLAALTLWMATSVLGALTGTTDYRNGQTVFALPSDQAKVAAALEANHVGPAFAYYWVARPLVFLSAGKLKIAVYQGPGAFADLQQPAETSAHPSWIFASDDPDGGRFAQFCAARRVTYRRLETTGVIVYADLSAPVSPKDFGVAWKFRSFPPS